MVEPIVIEGQRAWLKQYGKGSRAMALGLLNFVARRFHLDALRPPHRGGDAARRGPPPRGTAGAGERAGRTGHRPCRW